MEEPVKVEKGNFVDRCKENPWMLSTIILGIAVLLLITPTIVGRVTGNVVSASTAGENLIAMYSAAGISGLALESVEKQSGVYKVNINYQGQVVPVYMTKDGKLAGSLSPIQISNENSNQQVQEIPATERPSVELFVMSYCPYGTQAEKGILPVVALLGNKIDFKLRTVHYTLHGEKEDIENNRQLCIREEQGQDILNKYLVCILDSDNPNAPKDVSACEQEAGVDSVALQTCLNTNADDYFKSDSALSEGYGVQGSPTLIINGVESSAGRSPESYLTGICDAFTEEARPAECEQGLSTASPSAGFGYNEGTDTVAQC